MAGVLPGLLIISVDFVFTNDFASAGFATSDMAYGRGAPLAFVLLAGDLLSTLLRMERLRRIPFCCN